MHMAEMQRSTGVSNEEGTGGDMGKDWHSQCVCVGREGLVAVD